MAPRGKADGLLTDIPGQSPSLQDEKLVEQLLQLLTDGDEASLLTQVASALGANDYAADLRQQITVDSRLDFLRFCASQNYNPCKIVHLLRWISFFQETVVEKGRGREDMRNQLVNFVTSEIEEGWKCRQAPAAEDNAAEPPQSSKTSVKKSAKASEKTSQEEAEATPAAPRESAFLKKQEMGPFCTYLLHGMIEHASLFAYIANHARVKRVPREVAFFVEVPVPPPPPRLATAPPPDPLQAATEELRSKQLEEMTLLNSKYEEAVVREELRKHMERTEEEMRLLFEHEGTKKAVEDTYESLEYDLSQRQRSILQRIATLEKTLGVETAAKVV